MPRININEKDRTSPGTPGGYSNNTVLIAGFSAYTDDSIKANAPVQADDNGVFEFTSAEDFKKTIGLVSPTVLNTEDEALTHRLPEHYGNQMAYELLNMGYPVIYLNLGMPQTGVDGFDAAARMKKLGEDTTWAIFKDKASYDFRFISHGLLTSDECAKSEDLVKLEKRVAKMREFLPVFSNTDAYDETGAAKETLQDATIIAETQKHFEAAVTAETAYLADANKKAERKAIGYTSALINQPNFNWYLAEGVIAANKAIIKEKSEEVEANAFQASDFIAANAAIAKLAHYRAVAASDGTEDEMHSSSGRGDCIALIEVDEADYIKDKTGESKRPEARIIAAINGMAGSIDATNTGKYCACTVPSVVYNMTVADEFYNNKKLPGAFHYLACFNNSLGLGFAEWYAAAGYTRGVSSYSIDHTSVKLGEVAVQALEPRNNDGTNDTPKFAVNVIANFRGSYYLWGNRTCHLLGDVKGTEGDLVASHFLNIRQLCTTIKKQLYVSCRRFTFDPNSDVLWINFKNSITPMLDRMKADQGVRDYKIEKVYTDKKATLKARIRIVPIEAVEDFLLEVSLEDSLGETAVTIAE